MGNPEKALAERIRELRRRHFGTRGRAQFAERLNLPLNEYARYERGTVPPGEVLVRICDATGEDLQWLLTGTASRGTVVISGARNRHQDLLARLAQVLDTRPQLARSLESFLDLLLAGDDVERDAAKALSHIPAGGLIPVYAPAQWPESLPDPDRPGGVPLLAESAEVEARSETVDIVLAEPAMEYNPERWREATLLVPADSHQPPTRFIRCRDVAQCFAAIFGVTLADESMSPMLRKGDIALVAPGVTPSVGRPAVCRFASTGDSRCRVWLGADQEFVNLGRIQDGHHERAPRAQLLWSLEVIYRVAQAA